MHGLSCGAGDDAPLAGLEALDLSFDDFIRTSSDPRHRAGVERLWRACAAAGDLYRKHYEGRYCVGCEQFYTAGELRDGRCPEHDVWPAMLLSAGEPLPTEILVHDYLTVDGRKLSKSSGNAVDPVALAERFGADAVRWWLLREVPRGGEVAAGRWLDGALGALVQACRVLAAELAPFLPSAASRIAARCDTGSGLLPSPEPLFHRARNHRN